RCERHADDRQRLRDEATPAPHAAHGDLARDRDPPRARHARHLHLRPLPRSLARRPGAQRAPAELLLRLRNLDTLTTPTAAEASTVRDGIHYHQHDVVIVGAGGAGMRAAIEAG